MFQRAQPSDRWTQVWSKEFKNFLLDQIRQDINLVKPPKSFTYDPIKALAQDNETFLPFTPVALVGASQIRGGHKSPVVKVNELTTNATFGVVQSKCTQKQAADIIVNGLSWCNVTINNASHEYAAISGTSLVSQADSDGAVAKIIVDNASGPSLIYFPLPGTSAAGICPNLFNLPKGVYRAVAAETIPAGQDGQVLLWTCEEPTVQYSVTASNFTNCEFYLNDPVVTHIDDCCTVFFTGCPGPTPTECNFSVSVCIAGVHKILKPGEFFTWNIPSGNIAGSCCFEPRTREITITITCIEGVLSAAWDYVDGVDNASGTINLSTLFDLDNNVEMFDQITIPGCSLKDRFANFVDTCPECGRDCEECTQYTISTPTPPAQITNFSITPNPVNSEQLLTLSFDYQRTSGNGFTFLRIVTNGQSFYRVSYDTNGKPLNIDLPGTDACIGTGTTTGVNMGFLVANDPQPISITYKMLNIGLTTNPIIQIYQTVDSIETLLLVSTFTSANCP